MTGLRLPIGGTTRSVDTSLLSRKAGISCGDKGSSLFVFADISGGHTACPLLGIASIS